MLAIFFGKASRLRGSGSNRHAARHAPRNFQQVSLHVNDLVVAVPFAGEEVLQAVGLELDGAIDEAVLVGAGVVPERVRLPERDVRLLADILLTLLALFRDALGSPRSVGIRCTG